MEPKKERIACIQWLRIFAAAAVVVMHTAAVVWNRTPMEAAPWKILTVYDALVRWPVPVFAMITGALFLPRRTELKTVLTRYIPRMLLLFLLWSGLYVRYRYLHGLPAENLWVEFANGQYHLWYLPFLCGVYLTLPFLQKIAEDERLTAQLLAVSLTVGSAIPWGLDLWALLSPDWAPVFASIKNHLNFSFFFDLLFALVLGHWLMQRKFTVRGRLLLYGAGILSLILTVTGTLHLSAWAGKPVTLFFSHSAPTSLCAAAALFVFAKYNLSRLPRLVDGLAKSSFGVYLGHALLIEHLYEVQLHALTWDVRWSVPAVALLVYLVCAAAAALIRKIPVVGKFLV